MTARTDTYKFQQQLLDKTTDRKKYTKDEQANSYRYEIRYFPELKGRRAILHPLKEKKYEELQQSRGIAINNTRTRKQLLEKVKIEASQAKHDDRDRLHEVNNYVNISKDINKVVEIGFRVPLNLELYRQLDCQVFGYDIVNFNVKIARDLGYDCARMDLSNYGKQNLEELKDADLVICYHVMEHLSRPDLALRNIFSNMKEGALFHVEVPIERLNYPNIDAGHMFTFYDHDLERFLQNTGFELVRDPTAKEGYERCLVKKQTEYKT